MEEKKIQFFSTEKNNPIFESQNLLNIVKRKYFQGKKTETTSTTKANLLSPY